MLVYSRDNSSVLQAREDEKLHRSDCRRLGRESRAAQVTEPTERDGVRSGEIRGSYPGVKGTLTKSSFWKLCG